MMSPSTSKQQSLNFKRILNPGRSTGSTVVINVLQKTYYFLVKYFSSMKANAEWELKAKKTMDWQ